MEPLTPNDPLWKVLGQAKPVEPRPNFTQNMVRLARQTPQERGWLPQINGWWQAQHTAPAGLTWAAVAALALAVATFVYQPETTAPTVAMTPAQTVESNSAESEFPLVPEFETEWKNLEQMGDLLAVNDTSLLTDSEINILLY